MPGGSGTCFDPVLNICPQSRPESNLPLRSFPRATNTNQFCRSFVRTRCDIARTWLSPCRRLRPCKASVPRPPRRTRPRPFQPTHGTCLLDQVGCKVDTGYHRTLPGGRIAELPGAACYIKQFFRRVSNLIDQRILLLPAGRSQRSSRIAELQVSFIFDFKASISAICGAVSAICSYLLYMNVADS